MADVRVWGQPPLLLEVPWQEHVRGEVFSNERWERFHALARAAVEGDKKRRLAVTLAELAACSRAAHRFGGEECSAEVLVAFAAGRAGPELGGRLYDATSANGLSAALAAAGLPHQPGWKTLSVETYQGKLASRACRVRQCAPFILRSILSMREDLDPKGLVRLSMTSRDWHAGPGPSVDDYLEARLLRAGRVTLWLHLCDFIEALAPHRPGAPMYARLYRVLAVTASDLQAAFVHLALKHGAVVAGSAMLERAEDELYCRKYPEIRSLCAHRRAEGRERILAKERITLRTRPAPGDLDVFVPLDREEMQGSPKCYDRPPASVASKSTNGKWSVSHADAEVAGTVENLVVGGLRMLRGAGYTTVKVQSRTKNYGQTWTRAYPYAVSDLPVWSMWNAAARDQVAALELDDVGSELLLVRAAQTPIVAALGNLPPRAPASCAVTLAGVLDFVPHEVASRGPLVAGLGADRLLRALLPKPQLVLIHAPPSAPTWKAVVGGFDFPLAGMSAAPTSTTSRTDVRAPCPQAQQDLESGVLRLTGFARACAMRSPSKQHRAKNLDVTLKRTVKYISRGYRLAP